MYPVGTVLKCISKPDIDNNCIIVKNDASGGYPVIGKVLNKNKANPNIYHSGPCAYLAEEEIGPYYRFIKADLSSDDIRYVVLEQKPILLKDFLAEE